MVTGNQTCTMPIALNVDDDEVPYAESWFGVEGIDLKVLVSDVEGGFFVVRVRFAPGIQLPKHHHTGAVHAYTFSGEWTYLEYPDSRPNRAGSYLYEPPGSAHTLKVADHNTEPTEESSFRPPDSQLKWELHTFLQVDQAETGPG